MKLFKKDYSVQTDEHLMKFFQKGDKKAFEEIYNRYADHLVNFFYQKLWQDRTLAEDATQDIFAKLISNPLLFDTAHSFKSWVFSVAYNRCKNEYKKRDVRKNTAYDLPERDITKSNQLQSDEQLDQSNFGESLKKELSEMDDKHASVFSLRHEQGLSMKEISEVLGINEGNRKIKATLCN